MKRLDPKSVWMFFFGYLIGWSIFMLMVSFTFVPIILSMTQRSNFVDYGAVFGTSSTVLLGVYLIFLALFYLFARLTYNNYSYELTPEGFRKEHGVIWKKYVTIPYARIQNVDIYRGLLARILGLSDLQIQTAGMSMGAGSYGAGSEGRLPGLNPKVAEELRNELVKRAVGKSQGL